VNTVKLNLLKKIYVGILLVIFGGIVLHAPVSVISGVLFPGYTLIIKSWKEILMLIAGSIALVLILKNKQQKILRDPIVVIIMIYAALHLLLVILFGGNIAAVAAGLAIDLRYLFFFVLVYVVLKIHPSYGKLFIKVGLAGAFVVIMFALLQIFILPYNALEYIGYSKYSILPYLLVDNNYHFIRINSTLRGPNPLGAYIGVVLSVLVAFIVKNKVKYKRQLLPILLLFIGGLVTLWISYSRSALIGAIIAVAVVLSVVFIKKISKKCLLGILIAVMALFGGLFIFRHTYFVTNILLHDNPNSLSVSNSNEQHTDSLIDGFGQLIEQPIGAGVGSTGSASIIGGQSEIIENQYLFIAHESGWIGLGLFLIIFIKIMYKLWQRRSDWLSLGVFAGGIGLALIGLLLPVWVDDTVSIIWWGLAAVALLYSGKDYNGKNKRIY